jgi:hypothetical protein
VVRGREPGRVFALAGSPDEIVLGNAPADPRGINLAGQESDNALRKMAPRHASLAWSVAGVALRDLESPGGTFVNRQRILPGQARALAEGDLIQLGGVQLRFVGTKGNGSAPPPATSAFAYAITGGPTCRNWDDFLTASTQRWAMLRDDLASGQLARFVVSIGRPDLAPKADATGSPDERLDEWLGSLPTTKPALPELDVHPSRSVIRVAPGGGTRRGLIRVANVGHRLLRSSARVEPPTTPWLTLAPELRFGSFLTVDESELAFDVAIPETLPVPLQAEIVVEGNGGTKRVTIVLEARAAVAEALEAEASTPVGVTLGELIARQSPLARVASWALVAMILRLIVGVAAGSIGEDVWVPSGPDAPGLGRVAVALAAVGGVIGGLFAARRGGKGEAPYGAFAGACGGVIVASAVVAACRSVEPALGSWSTSMVAVGLVWALIGAGLAGLSTLFVKGKP